MSGPHSLRQPRIFLPARYHPPTPPPPELGPGDMWLKTVEPEDYSRHPDFSRQEVYCELFLVWIDEVNNTTIFVNEDAHELHASVYIPINSGIPDQYRVSPVVIVEKWLGWREWRNAPEWTRWIPGETKSFVDSRAAVALLFGLLSTNKWNKPKSEAIWEWTTVISVGTPAEEAFHIPGSSPSAPTSDEDDAMDITAVEESDDQLDLAGLVKLINKV
ncbi:hypothetical protein NEOLEDRAFT_1180336 [Neolentinus lepideus HHB14362 ss-1]|uniref:Uncharacterized protein n=1 Tax=Neolentinus lepideus HHB14362 ss-1 TaxID=1314782 RepID=A0A165QZL1_9AGAM|nr:hypothetical protein NEOLEDRAFT_1180336 [Neolentinus lepideus HHB14362 ss-1]